MPIEARIIMESFFLAMAGLWGGLSIYMLRRSYKRKIQGTAAAGVVVGHTVRVHGDISNTTYSPEVEFETRSGEKIVFTASFSSGRMPSLGRKVKVLYYPNNPHDADMASSLASWIVPLLLLAFGLSFLCMAVAVLFAKGA
jgi:hypothetical protein